MTSRRARRLVPLLIALPVVAGECGRPAKVPGPGFHTRWVRGPDGRTVRYGLFVPRGHSPDVPAPVILFLHGGGEAGTDGVAPTRVGLGPAVRDRAATFPFVVVFPQASEWVPGTFATWTPGGPDAGRALAALAAVERDLGTDPDRVYLTGISIGGFGTWRLAAADPGRWAAVVPVCGRGPAKQAGRLTAVPCWCFHGTQDGVVDVDESRGMVEAVEAAGGRPRYTEYRAAGHDCWDRAYATPELYDWLLSHRRR